MSLPLKKDISLIYGDKLPQRFQLLVEDKPITDNLLIQTILFTITSKVGVGFESNFEPIVKNIVDEGWVLDNTQKIVRVKIDTGEYLMTPGIYMGILRWENEQRTLVVFDIYVNPAPI